MLSEEKTHPDILSMDLSELENYLSAEFELPRFRAKQIYKWLSCGKGFDDMTNLPLELRKKLKKECFCSLVEPEQKLVSEIDGTIKYLYRLYDGNHVESVVMHYEHGTTICISSEVGCNMGCRFCASAIGGMTRRLLPGEMLGQVVRSIADGNKINGIVMMGIGEPLDNYDNVIKFLKLVSSEDGVNIGARHISLSTCGIVDKIYKLSEEMLGITLSISLHASNDDARSSIMPINNKWKIGELMKACKHYFLTTGRRISFEYTLIYGKNDSEKDANALADLFYRTFTENGKLLPMHINLIPVNKVREREYTHGSRESIRRFESTLSNRGINATVRRTLGPDINASCGQLRKKRENIIETTELH